MISATMAGKSKLNPKAPEFFPTRPRSYPPFFPPSISTPPIYYSAPPPNSGDRPNPQLHELPPGAASSSGGNRGRRSRWSYDMSRNNDLHSRKRLWRQKNDVSEYGRHCSQRKNSKSKGNHPILAVDESSDSQNTTCMIRNIPNRYTRDLLMEFLEEFCRRENELEKENSSAFDFLYLPIDFKNKANKGYAFVNFTNPDALWKFKRVVDNRVWPKFSSKKICSIAYARLQGKEELVRHFEKSVFECDNDDYLPLLFSPARDGSVTSARQKVIGRRF